MLCASCVIIKTSRGWNNVGLRMIARSFSNSSNHDEGIRKYVDTLQGLQADAYNKYYVVERSGFKAVADGRGMLHFVKMSESLYGKSAEELNPILTDVINEVLETSRTELNKCQDVAMRLHKHDLPPQMRVHIDDFTPPPAPAIEEENETGPELLDSAAENETAPPET
eukprot:gnl/Spiro4/1256_TR673_c0_g2_i1.p1 gnl/Spiro4/1256_TR673_c0_g2~~gnl/Spiro4/1256_TR673_c0_g2_i1.p1  ORF type:complete len:168 (-),score=38.58 gnl/Spiro4/1256_TR673_c0_g2_i1:228-731(-)